MRSLVVQSLRTPKPNKVKSLLIHIYLFTVLVDMYIDIAINDHHHSSQDSGKLGNNLEFKPWPGKPGKPDNMEFRSVSCENYVIGNFQCYTFESRELVLKVLVV